jgi:hypothetical protein
MTDNSKYETDEDVYDTAAALPSDFRIALEDYYVNSPGTNVWKLQNFSKYVPRQALTSFITRYELFKMVLNVQGSVAEMGVLAGGSLLSWAQMSSIFEPLNHQRKVIGFDMYGENPAVDKKDGGESSDSHIYVDGGLALDTYQDIKNSASVYDKNRTMGSSQKVILVKGDATNTVPEYLDRHPETLISLLYLDINLYSPSKAALEHFIPRMPKGAIIVFDGLNGSDFPGETLAVMDTIGVRNIRIERFSFETNISYAIID